MHLRRVVITGMGAVSPFGKGVEVLIASLLEGKSGTVFIPELKEIGELRSRLGALVQGVNPKEIPRKQRRTMSKMSVYALLACREALAQSGDNVPEAAKLLGIGRATLYRKIEQYHIQR